MPDATAIGLKEAIQGLRDELSESMADGADKSVRFRVGPVELEFLVEVSREATGSGGVKFWVVELGAGGSSARTTTHRSRYLSSPSIRRREIRWK